jgi:hypothetical protein
MTIRRKYGADIPSQPVCNEVLIIYLISIMARTRDPSGFGGFFMAIHQGSSQALSPAFLPQRRGGARLHEVDTADVLRDLLCQRAFVPKCNFCFRFKRFVVDIIYLPTTNTAQLIYK